MNTVAKIIGYAYVVASLAGLAGLIDMYVCIGQVGSCIAQPHAVKKAVTV